MSHLDPYGGRDPRGWERPGEPRGWPEPPGDRAWPRGREDPRAWRHGATPEAYARPSTYEPTHEPAHQPAHEPTGPYGTDDPAWGAYRPPDPSAHGRPDPSAYGSDPSAYGSGPAAYGSEPGTYGPPDPAVTANYGTGQPAAIPEPPRGRRTRGRRRAGARRTAGQPAATGRAGRNLPAAIGVGLFLAAVVLSPLFLFRPAFSAVVALAASIGIWETARAVRARGVHPPLVPLVAGAVLMTGLAWRAGPDGLSLGLLVTVLATMIWRLGDGPAGYQRDLPGSVLIAVYVPFLAGFAALLAVPPDGQWRVLVTLAAVVLSDTGGYAVGVFLGKHPMAPSVSPKKSWEGFGGSVVAAAAGSAVLLFVLLDVAPWWGALFGLAVSISAVLGDLGESMLKRDLGIKDMSRLLPGHGGLMDRLDSILFAVPTAYLLLSILVPAA